LEKDRIDLIVSGWEAFENDARTIGIDPESYETVYTVDTGEVCFAFHRDASGTIIGIFQKAFDAMTAEGVTAVIMERYGRITR
jgi:hypothetical protein